MKVDGKVRRYVPRGYTYDPCPGCESTKEARPMKGVCTECRGILIHGRKARAELAERGAGEPKLYRVPEMPHWLPYLAHDTHEHPIQNAFHALVFAVTAPNETGRNVAWTDETAMIAKPKGSTGSGSSGDVGRVARPSVREAVNDLFQTVYEGLRLAYVEGKEDGRRLLAGLASGELSPKDFEERGRR